jgi:anaerobic magnesium-protoporphyrin IX monomethyl ester cyclase
MKVAFVIHQVEYSIPMGVAYCAAVLKKAGFECEVFEAGLNPAAAVEEIAAYAPEVVGFSVYTGFHQILLSICAELKKRLSFVSIFGGPHPTFYPDIIHQPGVDAVCRGEGEEALAEFVTEYAKRGEIPGSVANFTVRRGDELEVNPVRPLLEELDTLPFPDRMLFIRKYPSYNRHGVKHFVAHRGCPYQCTYCFNHAFNRLYGVQGRACFRSRDPLLICYEILQELGRMKLEMVSFVDDCFTLDKEWTLRFCRIYRDRVGLPFQMNTRVENLDHDIIRDLKAANCWLIHIGVESGDEEYRKKVLKRGMSNRLIIDRIRACRKAGIRVLSENVIALPNEKYEGACATLRLNMEARPDYVAATFFMPYPGLELTEFAVKAGVYHGKVDAITADYIHTSLLDFETPGEKRKIINLRSFFNLAVRHPWLWPFIDLLTGLPPNPIFRLAGDLIDGYYLWKLLPYRISPLDLLSLFHQYLFAYRKTVDPGKRKRRIPPATS